MAAAMKYSNMEELKKDAELSQELQQRMRMIRESSILYTKARQLFNGAVDASADPEGAFILFSRCMNICYLILQCRDFKVFEHTRDAQPFHQIFDRSLNEYARLETQLTSIYDDLAVAKLQTQSVASMTNKELNMHPVDREDFGNFIKPQQLVDYVDKYRKIVLILDYRLNKEPQIRYFEPNFIRVLPLELNLIAAGLIYNHLRMYIDFRYRPTISEIQNYDLVVLVGDELQEPNAAPFKNGTKTKILLDAITVYNYHNQLKRNPLLLEGGFKAWENAYPMYVEGPNEHRQFEDKINFSDEFSQLVQLVKQNIGSELEYPELFSKLELSPKAPSSPPRHVPVNLPPKEVTRPAPSLPPSSLPQPSLPSKPPSLPSKSIESTSSSTSIMNSTEFPVSFGSEPVAFDKKLDCKAEIVAPKFDKRLPLVPTLGGARMDTSNPAPVVVPNRSAQPPIPERPVRPPIDPETQQQLLNITHVYEHSMRLIERNAAFAKVPPGYTGLVNLGNTCFMNSALQALFNTPGIRKIFGLKKFASYINPRNKSTSKGMISACFAALFDSIWLAHYKHIHPDNFLNLFAKEVNSQLADRTQHDSQEFLSLLVDALHEETNRVEVKRPFEQNYDGKNIRSHAEHYNKNLDLFASSPINDIFGLKSITQLTCRTCNTSSVTFCDNPLTLLELPVDHRSYLSLRQCLDHSFGTDDLDGTHRWNCPHCKVPQRTLRLSKIWSLPPVLVICLKRFAMRNGDFVKNDIDVDFDINDLDMSAFIHKEAPMNLQPRYQLYALTNHEGTLNSGHYTSIIHNSKTGRWLKFDDERVFEIDPQTIQSKKAYILFYRNVGFSGS